MRALRQQVFHVLWLLALPPTRTSHTQLQMHGVKNGLAMVAVSCIFDAPFLTLTSCNACHTLMVTR
jgi:hypothetical protein